MTATEATVGQLITSGILQMSDGYRTKRAEHGRPGFRIIRVADVGEQGIALDGPDFVSQKFKAAIGQKIGKAGDILLTTKGTVGRVAVVPGLDEDVVYSPQLCYFRVIDESRLSPGYLRFWFSSTQFWKQAADRMNNTDMAAYINLADIRSLRISLPSPIAQRAIAEVLGALDDKIAANATVVTMILKHLDAEFQAATESAPSVRPVGDSCLFLNKRRIPLSARQRELRPGDVPYYGATGIFGTVDEHLFDQTLVLIGEDGSVVTDAGKPVAQYIWGRAWVNNHAHVIVGRVISPELLFIAIRRQDVRHLITGAVQPKISMGKLRSLELMLPDEARLGRIESLCHAEMALYRSATDESRTLAALRDTILPALMSGRLRVKDAERQVEAVV